MARKGNSEDSARGVELRASKDRLVRRVASHAANLGVRAIAGGGNIFAIHGLISPLISRTVSFVVAPRDVATLVTVMRNDGWVAARPRRLLSLLPSAVVTMSHEDWPCVLRLHSVIPGFFADPEVTFDVFWDRRTSIQLRNIDVQILDKISTVVFAAHDRLMGDRSLTSADSSVEYFLAQFREVLSATECRQLLEVVREVGGEQELRPFIEGLGLEVGPTRLPTDEYVRRRLALESVTAADAALLAYFELPSDQRIGLFRHITTSASTGALRALPVGLGAMMRLRTASRRVHDDWQS